MIAYLDSSVILRRLFAEPKGLSNWGEWSSALTSDLTKVEGMRSIDRTRVEKNWSEPEIVDRIQGLNEILDMTTLVQLDANILQKASEPFPTLVRTLDAIHLASAWLAQYSIKKPIHFLTHDAKLGRAALAMGMLAGGFSPSEPPPKLRK